MRATLLLALAAAAIVAGCGVETVEIERQPASAFGGEAASAYDRAVKHCEKTGRNLEQLARDVGVLLPKNAAPDEIAGEYASGEDDTEIASARYSGCRDGIEARQN